MNDCLVLKRLEKALLERDCSTCIYRGLQDGICSFCSRGSHWQLNDLLKFTEGGNEEVPYSCPAPDTGAVKRILIDQLSKEVKSAEEEQVGEDSYLGDLWRGGRDAAFQQVLEILRDARVKSYFEKD